MAKNVSDLCSFYSKLNRIFGKVSIKKRFLFFFMDFKLLMIILRNFQEFLNKLNLLKTCIKTTDPIGFCIIYSHFYHGQMI